MEPYKRPEMEQDPTKLPGQIVNPVPDEMVYGGGRGGPKNWFNMDGSPTIRNPYKGQRMEAHKKEYRARTLRDIIARIEREEEYSPHATVNS